VTWAARYRRHIDKKKKSGKIETIQPDQQRARGNSYSRETRKTERVLLVLSEFVSYKFRYVDLLLKLIRPSLQTPTSSLLKAQAEILLHSH
jgi:hypothetical protein